MIGERLREVFYFFFHNVGPLLLVTVPFGMAAAIAAHLYGPPVFMAGEQPQLEWRSALPIVLLEPLALALKVLVVHRLATGAPLAAGELVARALTLWPVMAGVGLLMSLVVGGAAMLLFIVPGVYLYARLGLAPILVAVESQGVANALAESWQRTREQQLELFLFTLVLAGGLAALMLGLFALVTRLATETTFGADLFVRSINEAGFVLLTIGFYRVWTLNDRRD